jgi:hypothetical protein
MRRDCKKKKNSTSEREIKKKLGDSVSLTKSFFPFVRVCYLFTFFSSLPVRFIFPTFFFYSPPHPTATVTVWQYSIYVYARTYSHTTVYVVLYILLKETERDARTHTDTRAYIIYRLCVHI